MNYQLFELLNGQAGRSAVVDGAVTFAATGLIYAVFVVAAGLGALALYRRRFQPLLELGAVLFVAFLGAAVLSHLSHQVRPFQSHQVHQLIPHDPGVSLPSDHATAAFALAFGVFAFLSRRWGIVLGVAAIAIGLSRVWVGVHYPGDILAAAVIGAVATLEVHVLSVWQRTPAEVTPR